MKIVPAILAENFDDFVLRVRQAETFADYVQVDLMDGSFVPSLSFPAEKLNSVSTSLTFEVHLMVKSPFDYMSQIFSQHLKKVIFHFESEVNHLEFADQMKKRGLDVGIAIKPETTIEEFEGITDNVDSLLFLTVDPGSYGSPFKPEVIQKIRDSRKVFTRKILAADGGVSIKNLKLFLEAGVDYVCVGSRIFLGDDPGHNYELFLKKLKSLEVRR
jgi:ribulose-phosphate 3-epimerase